jgi:hypothetical protein
MEIGALSQLRAIDSRNNHYLATGKDYFFADLINIYSMLAED